MKKTIVTLFLIFIYFSSTAQLNVVERGEDKDLQNSLSNYSLADNQFFNYKAKGLIILFNILPENNLHNHDSLLNDSRRLKSDIYKLIGNERPNEFVCIAYIGRTTDKYNLYFNYKNNVLRDEVPLEQFTDTLLAPNVYVRHELENIGANKYTRHKWRGNQLSIELTILSQFTTLGELQQRGARDAARLLLNYLHSDYCAYSNIRINYRDKYTYDSYGYVVSITELIMAVFNSYLTPKQKDK